MEIQWKVMNIRCTNIPDLLRNLISLKVQNRENSRELCTLDVQIVRICKKQNLFVKCIKS